MVVLELGKLMTCISLSLIRRSAGDLEEERIHKTLNVIYILFWKVSL